MMADNVTVVPHMMVVPHVMAIYDVHGARRLRLRLGIRVDTEHAVDAASDAADHGADNGADRTGHAVALMEAVAGAFGDSLRLGGERQRREAGRGDDELQFHWFIPVRLWWVSRATPTSKDPHDGCSVAKLCRTHCARDCVREKQQARQEDTDVIA
jgi:hypothetical protein